MAAALAIGRRGMGLCAPNPAVGALVVKDGVILARGWTMPGGRPHGETEALRGAGSHAKGATLYVSLEPCSHHGKTPPCTDAIIAAGISRVVYAVSDPDPRACGLATRFLEEAQISVTANVLAHEAKCDHLGHFLCVSENRPMVTLKLAVTADGYAAAGEERETRLMITGEPANRFVHILRAMHDAILIGIGTALADDPLLTVRLPGVRDRKPLRIVLDSGLRLPLRSRLVETAAKIPLLVIGAEGAAKERAAGLRAAQAGVVLVRRETSGRVDLLAALKLLAARGLTRILCEGGPQIGAALIAQKLADDAIIFTSPKSLGQKGILGLGALAATRLADPFHYRVGETRRIGEDRLTRYERVM